MSILPVIDLQDGWVVRGVAGRRDEYRPIQSQLCPHPSPAGISNALRQAGFSDVYVADLDALSGGAPQVDAYRAIGQSRLRLVIDAGLGSCRQAERWMCSLPPDCQLTGVVIPLESLESPDELPRLYEFLGESLAVFSLDLRDGRPLTRIPAWRNEPPLSIARSVAAAGFRRLIVLDLAQVGSGTGPMAATWCRELRSVAPIRELISGGGVRNLADVRTFEEAGCHRVLVASALHDGRIRIEDV